MPCTLPEHITEQLAASEERFHNVENRFVALSAKCVKVKGQLLRFEVMADDTKQLQLSTGVTFESWKAWWDYLKSTAANVVSKSSSKPEEVGRKFSSGHNVLLSLEDQLLLTLMRLRLGRMKQELTDQFGISRSAVSRCLITWVNVSALWFAAYLATLESGLKSSPQYMPTVLAQSYPETFCIMNATELRCESPSSLSGQSQLQISYHTERVSWDCPKWSIYSCEPAIFCGYR